MCFEGAHLSLGWSLIAQHGKSATRDRQVHGQGRKRGPSHSDINNIANSNKTDDADSSDSCGSWDYDHDNGVFASCEDNADAEVSTYLVEYNTDWWIKGRLIRCPLEQIWCRYIVSIPSIRWSLGTSSMC